MPVKAIFWVGSALEDLRAFPEDARRQAGYELYLVQHGAAPSDWKPMPTVGAGVSEIRIHAQGEYRVVYLAKFPEGINVLHAFQKKSRRTAKSDVEVARRRLRAVRHLRRQGRR